jgi:hypothetical protein
MQNTDMQILTAALVATSLLFAAPAFAHRDHDSDGWQHTTRGAPGPIAGVGLPVMAIAGGIYWLIRRRKQT